MNREDIVRMAREAGLHIATDVNWMPIISLEYAERFAALVLANNPPQSSMAWQEGYEAGKKAERERLQAFMRQMIDSYSLASDSNAIRERGNA
jgi:deoxyribodipyrimidine photolyase